MLTKAVKWSGEWGLATNPALWVYPKAHRPWDTTVPEPPGFFMPYEEPEEETNDSSS